MGRSKNARKPKVKERAEPFLGGMLGAKLRACLRASVVAAAVWGVRFVR